MAQLEVWEVTGAAAMELEAEVVEVEAGEAMEVAMEVD